MIGHPVPGALTFRISQYLGHSDSQITERVYARVSPDDQADAL